MCHAVGMSGLAIHNKESRAENQDVLNQKHESLFISDQVSVWIEIFRKSGVKCATNKSLRVIHDDPQAHSLGLITENDSYNLGRIKMQGLQFRFSRTQGKLDLQDKKNGENTACINDCNNEVNHLTDNDCLDYTRCDVGYEIIKCNNVCLCQKNNKICN